MPIEFKNDIFHMYNDRISYCIQLSEFGDLLHLYWGKRLEPEIDYPIRYRTGFSAPENGNMNYSLDILPQEYPSYATSDLRSSALELEYPNGNILTHLTYKSHSIQKGKPIPGGLPGTYTENDDEACTLYIVTEDTYNQSEVTLVYTIYENRSVICRHSHIKNTSADSIFINNASSLSLDFHESNYKYMHLCGSWSREKHIEICDIHSGIQAIDSKRGASSHAENPFIALLSENACEDYGDVYGISLVYSGNFRISMEKEQYGTLRIQAGINPYNFKWKLESGDTFTTPEAVMIYSDSGLSGMSHTYHSLYRERLCRGIYRDKVRPILINSWEGSYFDFNENSLVSLAKKSSDLGIELFVLDDGWFRNRNDEHGQIGDWIVDSNKLPNGLDGLIEKINQLGLMFGLWFEPEVFSPKSEVFAKHPEWAIRLPETEGHLGRWQYLLDLSRTDVQEHLINTLSNILSKHNIEYVKWDMNRNFSDIYSSALPYDRQGELSHRYILGLYRILDTLTSKFPNILFEGCSGGGGRNDAGMLYYMPQNWASDNTDAVERLYIQYGASIVYPASTIGAHVSAVPNHQVGRVTPMKLRGSVAMSGMFGYELDITKLSDNECAEIKEQIQTYKRIREIITFGTQYRLLNPFENRSAGWMFVSKDKSKAVAFYFNKLAVPHSPYRRLKLKGLDENRIYTVDGKQYNGSTLMNYGLWLPCDERDFESCLWEINS